MRLILGGRRENARLRKRVRVREIRLKSRRVCIRTSGGRLPCGGPFVYRWCEHPGRPRARDELGWCQWELPHPSDVL